MSQSRTTFAEDPDKALAEFGEYGFHIEPNLVSDDDCGKLIEAARALPAAVGGSLRPAMNPHKLVSIFEDSLRAPSITGIMRRILNGPISGLQTEFFYCPPGTKGFALHQDNFFAEAPDGCFASAWIALTDISLDMGALVLYPKTNKLGLLPVRALEKASNPTQDPNAANEQSVVPDGFTGIPAPMGRGSVVFLHGYVVHGSLDNQSANYRYALLQTYLKTGSPFRPGNTAKREELVLQ